MSNFEQLQKFLTETMRMSGPYQPIVVKALLEHGGKSTVQEVARTLAMLDREAVAYYVAKLKINPKQVLQKHRIAKFEEEKVSFMFDLDFDEVQRRNLIRICDSKLEEYYENQSEIPGRPAGWGALRVRMITETPWCHLCGARPSIGNDISLDIDHIDPQSKGGSDEPGNLQVLCHPCNRAKGNSILRSAKEAHAARTASVSTCVFCNAGDRVTDLAESVFAIVDKYPVTTGHTLVIPKRHVPSAIDLTDLEALETVKLAREITKRLRSADPYIAGFNLGYNVGTASGQTVDHAHFHIIPRRERDVEDPVGGIRGVVPDKRRY